MTDAVATADRAQAELTSEVAALRGRSDDEYDNSSEQYLAVACGDGKHPSSAWSAMGQARRVDRPGVALSQTWAWSTVPCSPDIWKAQDEDTYYGPFTKKLRNPLLVIGNEWDPATNINDARKTARTQPGSFLVTANNWGHTSLGRSACVDGAVVRFFTDGTGAANTTCADSWQPFTATQRLGADDEALRSLPMGVERVEAAFRKN